MEWVTRCQLREELSKVNNAVQDIKTMMADMQDIKTTMADIKNYNIQLVSDVKNLAGLSWLVALEEKNWIKKVEQEKMDERRKKEQMRKKKEDEKKLQKYLSTYLPGLAKGFNNYTNYAKN